MDDDAAAVIRQAERIIYRASWLFVEGAALAGLAGSCGLRRAPLEPRSDVIQLVTYNGEHLGHVRRDRSSTSGETWVAVSRATGQTIGCYPAALDAAEALALACGKQISQHG
ncbi:MAG TPA: hypothetical protein VMF87_22820 [Streptosporangiaceae bacterium]|nr:hypothetical protein [Streptosporangiaceae bacterium]